MYRQGRSQQEELEKPSVRVGRPSCLILPHLASSCLILPHLASSRLISARRGPGRRGLARPAPHLPRRRGLAPRRVPRGEVHQHLTARGAARPYIIHLNIALSFARKIHVSNGQNVSFEEPCEVCRNSLVRNKQTCCNSTNAVEPRALASKQQLPLGRRSPSPYKPVVIGRATLTVALAKPRTAHRPGAGASAEFAAWQRLKVGGATVHIRLRFEATAGNQSD